ncbi:MAG TPA: preprotein translocase subunit SecE [Chloroflexia bacterium]|nr:preprotein translocase subunit SecE [Chloroflexia bacterium]
MGKKRGSGTPAAKATGKKGQQPKGKQQEGRIAATSNFVRGVRNELRRVSWPNRDQLRQSTAVVLIIVVVLGVYVAAWDFVYRTIASAIFT